MPDLNRPCPERTAALIEIYAVLNRYAYLARENSDWDALGQLLTSPDVKIIMPGDRRMPLLELKNVLRLDEVNYLRHNITAIEAHFESETQARVNTQLFASTDWSKFDHWGEWQDMMTRDGDGRWLIQERTVIIEGVDPEGWGATNAPA